ncbi:hypothetical protein [Acrocarpospora catenulata]|uniref:hypothetical protein n=1 Tax=Acrocarpospora catenulata TaxID=2836182 RepID=UPI001BDAD332|nr:hypothetical protein [Acrocarpospora catenulata]
MDFNVLVRLDLGAEEELMGAGSRFNREAGITLGRPSVLDVARDQLPPEVTAARDFNRWTYLQLLFPFDLEEPEEGMSYLEAEFAVTLDGEAVGRRLSATRYDDRALGDLTAFGESQSAFRWRLRPQPEEPGLTDGSRVARVLLQVPAGVTALTGVITAAARLADPELGLEVAAATVEPQPFALRLTDGTYTPIMTGPDPAEIPTGGVRRLCVAVDVEAYSKRDTREHERLQDVLVKVIDQALAAALRPVRGCDTQEQGDGQLVILPAGIDEPSVIRWFLRELASGLAAENRPVQREYAVRIRIALDEDVVHPGRNGFAGHGVIRACRMRDSPVAKQALKEAAGHHVVIVSDAMYEGSVKRAFDGDAAWRFTKVSAVIEDKGFTAECWIHVP